MMGNDVDAINNGSHMILSAAMGRWLNVSEIESLLNPNTTLLPLCTAPPSSPPPSGTLLLYNRSITRNYKDDGYRWIKKKNSHKVREDHVKLRVGGKFRVSGCYVHGASVTTLHRRAYHLLNPDTGTALYPVSNSANRNVLPSLVLVHYLDTKIASQYATNLMVPKSSSIRPSHSRTSSIGTEALAYHGQSSRSFSGWDESFNSAQFADFGFSPRVTDHVGMMPSNTLLGVETLDYLWDVLFKEGEERLEETLATGNFPVDPSIIKEMLDAKEAGHDLSSKGNNDEFQDVKMTDSSAIARGIYLNQDEATPTVHHDEMVEIVDVTPSQALTNQVTKVVISCSDPIAHPGNDGQNSAFSWHTLAAFVVIEKDSNTNVPRATSVDLVQVKNLNPFACKAELPPFLKEDDRYIILVAVFLDAGVDPICQGIAASIGLVLEQSWSEHMNISSNSSESWLRLSSLSQTVVEGRPFIRLLTQMSKEKFSFVTPKHSEDSSDKVVVLDVMETDTNEILMTNDDLPAPAPHMALVATALSDFPNPPVKAVLPSTTTLSFKGPNDQQQSKPLGEITDESPETKRIIKEALEATVVDEGNSKKRPNSLIEVGPNSMNDIPIGATAWASKPSNAPQSETKAEELDRHCKIRFVERLNDVISEAEPNAAVSDEKFKNMDDEELDDMLDSLLVRIVESLVEVSDSGCDIKDELNIPDKSGFALLHYAAFYNLPTLIPVLLSRGANPDIPTTRGNLTPLHLACGAGNHSIAEILIRHGCALNVNDCFGYSPMDHAIRNGFTSLAEFLHSQIMKEQALRNAGLEASKLSGMKNEQSNQRDIDPDSLEHEKFLLQSAFSNLSLKDKLIFNMMVKKRGRSKSKKDNTSNRSLEAVEEEEDEEEETVVGEEHDELAHSSSQTQDNIMKGDDFDVEKKSNKKGKKGKKSWEVESVDSVITDTDKESLDIAMSLMNPEELEDLKKKSADDNEDLREWMLKRNYESLMEASQNLKNTMTKHGEKTSKSLINKMPVDAETRRSLKNMQSQALAGLVIRKNVIKKKKKEEGQNSAVAHADNDKCQES